MLQSVMQLLILRVRSKPAPHITQQCAPCWAVVLPSCFLLLSPPLLCSMLNCEQKVFKLFFLTTRDRGQAEVQELFCSQFVFVLGAVNPKMANRIQVSDTDWWQKKKRQKYYMNEAHTSIYFPNVNCQVF